MFEQYGDNQTNAAESSRHYQLWPSCLNKTCIIEQAAGCAFFNNALLNAKSELSPVGISHKVASVVMFC